MFRGLSTALWLALAAGPAPADGPRAAAPRTTVPSEGSSDQVVDVHIRTLTSIDWEDGDELPERIRELDGRRIVLAGYMRPGETKRVTSFLMVAAECACAGRPRPQHFVDVTLEDGDELEYRSPSVEILGTLSVGVVRDDDGFVQSLYRLTGRPY